MTPLSHAALPLPVASALALGEQLAHQLAALHAQGQVHAALRLESVAWESAAQRATLLEAEAAQPMPARAVVPQEAGLARLVYAAPEQSGRLELPVDARSDLYSLGVVLYAVLTGEPPFVGRDPLEQIHWHIAGSVPPPARRDGELPAIVREIVQRLLAKAPEDRYQTARSLAEDLARCAGAWVARRQIEPFVLARRDRDGRLAFGTALVGRQREVAQLRAAFARVAAGGRALVLVEGYAGVGKTALIQQLVRPIVRDKGLFIAGKFDQVVRGVPFGALIQAFQALVRQLLGESEERLAQWRERLRAALGVNGGVLAEVMPEIEFVIGPQPAPVPLPGTESQNRFRRVVQRFVAALATREQPLVLFLDDLQWADAATLALLAPLSANPDIGHLLLLGAFRDAELDASPLLARTLEALRAAEAPHERIALGPLSHGEITAWLAETLHTSADEAAPLAARVLAKTLGNPFFARQFLHGLQREGLLRFDAAAARWRWDLAGIDAAPLTDNVVDLMTRSIRGLPPATQSALTLAACIGNRFDLDTLARVSERPPDAAAADLGPAQAEGLVVAAGSGFAFLHDRVQQAAYALIPPERSAALHLTVGRLLRGRNAAVEPQDERLFDIVHHLNLGRSLIAEAAERREVAALDLAAGRRAKSATAYESALALFAAGLELAGGRTAPGPAEPAAAARLHFELALEAAECRYLLGEFDASLAAYRALVAQAPTPLDRARVLLLCCVQEENMARYAHALASGREALAPFGVHLPADEEAKHRMLDEEIARIERLRAGRPIAQLEALPTLQDPAIRTVMAVLTTNWSAAYIVGEPTLARLISATLVRLSLEHGNCEESAYGYVTHAITVGALRADYRAADEYGRLALAVNRRLDDRRLRAKVLQQFHAHVNFWCQPLRSCVPYAREACNAGLDAGDFVYAGYAAGTELWSALPASEDLAAFEREYAPSVALIERLNNPGFADMAQLMLAWARALRGQTAAPQSLEGAGFDEARWLARYGDVRFFACIHATARLQLAALLGTPAQALQAAQRAATFLDALPGTVFPVLIEFWHAYALARAAHTVPPDERLAVVEAVRSAQAAFAARVPHNAENHRAQALLLGAELARLQGDEQRALATATEALEFAAAAPLRPWQALSHEWVARAQGRLARPTLAAMHLARARELYAAWGAWAKVAALDTEQRAAPAGPGSPAVLLPASPGAAMSTPAGAAMATAPTGAALGTAPIGAALATGPTSAGMATAPTGAGAAPPPTGAASASMPEDAPGTFDLASVLKAAQAISAEAELEALLARLLHIAIENAGAERGALVLEGNHGAVVHSVEAGGGLPIVEALETSKRVPLAIVQYVRRSGETVVLGQSVRSGGAAAAERLPAGLGEDGYVSRHMPRSLACAPVRRLAQPVGTLYVEHRQAVGLFTPARLAMLRVLATQAAMAVENARLVEGLRAEVAERRQAQEWLAGALDEVQRLNDDLEAENSYLRRDLIANVSHDLRTPLVSLRGYLEVVAGKGDALGHERRTQYLGIALRQSERLAVLIDELFELARLDFKGMTLNRERFAFDELAADVVQKFELVAKSRNVALVAEASPGLPFVEADLGLVERVLENLIGNALKHTPADGRVRVSAHAEDGHVVAEVRDSGPGIAPADLPHVFDRYYRGSGAGPRAAERGAGLGLAIARRIVELHGGRIGAGSIPIRGAAGGAAAGGATGGARLWFTLPLASSSA